MLSYSTADYYHIPSGDYNSHTGVKSDIIHFDKYLWDEENIDNSMRKTLDISADFLEFRIFQRQER